MMGVQAMSAQLFYDFCLDDHVPSSHMLRSIDLHLNLDDVRQALKPFYSSTGRPSIDPELMIRMLIVGYCMGIRSERRFDPPSKWWTPLISSFGSRKVFDGYIASPIHG